MISGNALLCAMLLVATPTPTSTPPPPDVGALVAGLARPVPADTRFTEVRFVHVLQRPLVLHGSLHYGGPGRLGKHVQSPYDEVSRVDGDAIEVRRQGRQTRHFSLDRAPELKATLTSFSALLDGDARALEAVYAVQLTRAGHHWTLRLQPRDAALADHLRDVRVDGDGNEPACFALHQANGDTSVMLLGHLATHSLPDPPTRNGLAALCHAVP